MKKLFLFGIIIILSGLIDIDAQVLTNKRGVPVLPVKGDFAIGFDVVPLIRYAGGLFYDNQGNDDLSIRYPLSFTGKKLIKDDCAVRIRTRIGFKQEKTDSLVPKIGSTNANELVADEEKVSQSEILLGSGIMKYRGSGRLKGFYGGEALFMLSTNRTTYKYGNPLSSENQQQDRMLSNKSGTGTAFGLRGFVGVEYFIAPRLSLSAEYGWGLSAGSVGKNEIETESWDGSGVKNEITNTVGKYSFFGVDNDNNGGVVALSLYF